MYSSSFFVISFFTFNSYIKLSFTHNAENNQSKNGFNQLSISLHFELYQNTISTFNFNHFSLKFI